jgi:hypothetical protein
MKAKSSGMTRRDFLRGTAFAGLASTLGMRAAAEIAAGGPAAEESYVSKVFLVRHPDAQDEMHRVNVKVLSEMLDQIICAVAGERDVSTAWRKYAAPTDTVGLVPTSHLNATHKEVTQLVEEKLTGAGIPAKQIVQAQGKSGVHKGCTVLFPLPNLKAHWLTGIGTVLKNYIQFSGKASDYHQANSKDLGRIWNLPDVKGKTKLVVVDALRPLFDKGPQVSPEYLWHYNGVIAGTDPIAVEAVCLKIIQAKRDDYHGKPSPLSPPPICVEAADKTYKLGCSDLSKIKIVKMGWDKDILI